MDYTPGYVYELMEKGGPTDVREPYFKEAVSEMMRARKLCGLRAFEISVVAISASMFRTSS